MGIGDVLARRESAVKRRIPAKVPSKIVVQTFHVSLSLSSIRLGFLETDLPQLEEVVEDLQKI